MAIVLSACGGQPASNNHDRVTISVWSHGGTDEEKRILGEQTEAFNASHPMIRAVLTTISEGDYNDKVQAAAAANEFPDVLDLDGPTLANYAYRKRLAPLGELLPAGTVTRLLPSLRAQGTYDGKLYGVGTFDSGLGLFGNRKLLDAAGVRYPRRIDETWTADQFTAALRALSAHDSDRLVLDLKLNYGVGEWFTYAFSPLLWSAGTDLIDRDTGRAQGRLDSEAAVAALRRLADWHRYTDPNPQDNALQLGRVALAWGGHWTYPEVARALGRNLVLLPLPDLGNGPKTGQGSWVWTVSSRTASPESAAEFIDYLLRDAEVLRMATANGAVPGTSDALARSALYQPDAPLALYATQLQRTCGNGSITAACVAVPRPPTPAYSFISTQFATAVSIIFDGGDPRTALHAAAVAIDQDLNNNRGYRTDRS
ncbi:MAG: extracellular solute-binding protein [Dactylosporangium sp.]|nr:extracellular solute-binding protein [Dactylosporangium sp.]NNJ60500.1 extracellular solute-binding protein [Dactylosporangium sp.]